MDALWLVPEFVVQQASAAQPEALLLSSHVASVRMRGGVAATAWQRAGHHNRLLAPEAIRAAAQPGFSTAQLCVVGKFLAESDPAVWLAVAANVKKAGGRLVVDVCDYPFAKKSPTVEHFYEQVLQCCDAVTVNSSLMAELMAPHVLRPAQVIEDAILGTPRSPQFSPAGMLKLLWFGHQSNLPYLEPVIEALMAYSARQRSRLVIVTTPGFGVEQAAAQINAHHAPRFEVQFTPWSPEATRIALRQCDLVLIPGDPHDPLKAGVSSNRLAEALQAGRLPVASPLASYLPFSDAAWLGEDFVAGIDWALANRGEVLSRIRRGQSRVAEALSAAAIGRQWCSLFERLVGRDKT
jgi:hypothetical protein